MKMKLVLGACIASLALAACTAHSPTAARTLDPAAGPSMDGVGSYGSGGFADTTKAPPR
jgi:hypothetical protein